MTAVTVLRFDGAALGGVALGGPAPGGAPGGPDEVPAAVHEIYRSYRAGNAVVAVVRAPGSGPAAAAPPGAADRAAAARLVLALDRAGVPAAPLDPGPSAGQAAGPPASAVLRRADAARALRRLWHERVLVAPQSAAVDALLAGARAVGAEPRRPPAPARPLRVALLGLGTVGGGVYRHLLAEPGRFALTGIAVRDPERHVRAGVPAALLTRDPWRLLDRPCDLVIELIGGLDPAARLIAAALGRGRDVVTANKLVIAEEGRSLRRHAADGARLLCSAAAGGAVPVLEAVERAAAGGPPVRAIRGVLNGTANFVLDRLAAGDDGGAGVGGLARRLAAAVRAAQELGYAEADPSRDLDGSDAACKLRLLAAAAFGVDLAAGDVARRGLEAVTPAALADARRRGRVVRLVAECRRDGPRVVAAVRPVALPARDFLAGARGEENRVAIERRGAEPLRLAGRGAGRWPTAEAVLADLLDLSDLRAAPRGTGVPPGPRAADRAPAAAAGRAPAAHGGQAPAGAAAGSGAATAHAGAAGRAPAGWGGVAR